MLRSHLITGDENKINFMEMTANTILLVEDEEKTALSEAPSLRNEGYEVIHVYNGEQAIKAVSDKTKKIDIILMDIDLGNGMNGIEAAEKILVDHDIPIVFLLPHMEKNIVEKIEKITSCGYVVKGYDITILAASIHMAFNFHNAHKDLKEKEKALIFSENRFKRLVESVSDYIYTVNIKNGRVVNTSHGPGCVAVTGHTSEEYAFDPNLWYNMVYEKDRQTVIERAGMAATGKKVEPLEHRIWHKDGSIRWVRNTIVQHFDEQGHIFAYDGLISNITERKLTEEALRQTNEMMRTVLEKVPVGIFDIDSEGVVQNIWNPALERMLGWTRQEAIGHFLPSVQTEAAKEEFRKLREQMRSGKPASGVDLRRQRKDGSPIDYSIYTAPLHDIQGQITSNIAILVDITERKLAEQIMVKSLKEKEILLKELQHRVKNNLNIISSLLGLELDRLTDEHARKIFINAQSRIRSMSVIYEQLYNSAGLDTVDLSAYIKELSDSLIKTYAIEAGSIKLVFRVSEVMIDMKRAVSIGLILNELITNALKYAYPAGSKGEIRIDLEKSDGEIMLCISDDGTGMPDGYKLKTADSLGIRLVRMLTEQLGGSLNIESKKGTSVSLTFKI